VEFASGAGGGASGTATGGGVETVTMPAAPIAAFVPPAAGLVGTSGVTALLGGETVPAGGETAWFGPIGAVPADVDGICDRGSPEIGETSGSTGRTVTPGGSAAELVPSGTAGVTAPGVVDDDRPGSVGDAAVGAAPGSAGVLDAAVAEDDPAAALLLVPVLPVPVPELPGPVWASATTAPSALPTTHALMRNFVFMRSSKKISPLTRQTEAKDICACRRNSLKWRHCRA
jgi:hypothetical protein